MTTTDVQLSHARYFLGVLLGSRDRCSILKMDEGAPYRRSADVLPKTVELSWPSDYLKLATDSTMLCSL